MTVPGSGVVAVKSTLVVMPWSLDRLISREASWPVALHTDRDNKSAECSQQVIIITIDHVCVALFSGVHKLSALCFATFSSIF